MSEVSILNSKFRMWNVKFRIQNSKFRMYTYIIDIKKYFNPRVNDYSEF